MLFNSFEFLIFVIIAFYFYWFVFNKNLKLQNLFLLVVSYIFYGWWDVRFLSLIILSSTIDYLVGKALGDENNVTKRKFLLNLSIIFNITLLCLFKYFNFFIDSFYGFLHFIGLKISNPIFFEVILPVGISFYTFQSLSYTIDVYSRKIKPTKDIVVFFAFVGFFPQLVAGPIERAKNLLPQFIQKRRFDYVSAADGLRQILGGLFKKVVIADQSAIYVNQIFSNYSEFSGSTLCIAVILFAFQIYGDFSGYSDIAIGTARLFGFKLMTNFSYPYFSRDIAEFWRRWHISLTSWFKDYVYIPLGGSRGGDMKVIRNVMIVFLLSGLWHGANWTFVFWGLINALFFIPLIIKKVNRVNLEMVAKNKVLPTISEFVCIIKTFLIICFTWIFFRSESFLDAIRYLIGIFNGSILNYPEIFPSTLLVIISLFTFCEWIQRHRAHVLDIGESIRMRSVRWLIYYGVIGLIILYGAPQQEFIYFQF